MQKSVAAVNSLLQRGRAAIYLQARGYFLGEGEPNEDSSEQDRKRKQ